MLNAVLNFLKQIFSMISIVIPTYNERKNTAKIIEDIEKLRLKNIEIIVVDDASADGTADEAEKLNKKYKNIRVIRRPGKLGAASAVLDGFRAARSEYVGAMDADGSHPAEMLPKIFEALKEADFVIASRYVKGGGTKGWPMWRKAISRGATMMAMPLTSVKDPMSGFFFIRKSALTGKINPKSCKICLEIITKGEYKKIKEIPFIFLEREIGKTKMTKMHFPDYIKHVLHLYAYKLKGAGK